MKFPYGICDFRKIITQDYFYCDRTDRIPLLERGVYQLFLRPRRFGKSLLLSTLFNYYDVAKKEEFEILFGHLKIGKNPTALHNKYFVLQWDFSCVESYGDVERIRRALHDHINACIKDFRTYYRNFLDTEIEVDPRNAVNSIQSLITSVRTTDYPVYLLVDEYDNFANEVMMGIRRDKQETYEALVYEEGPLRTIFKAVKSSTKESLFDRIFITGVSPVVMSDITSGYNIAENVYLHPDFNDLCGFTHTEVEKAVSDTADECGLKQEDASEALDMMRTYYNGYRFSPDTENDVYNPTLAVYFLKSFSERCEFPREMLDSKLSMDSAKLEYISRISKGGQLLLDLVKKDHRVVIAKPADRFGIRQMLTEESKDRAFMVSFLYYFGVLAIEDLTDDGEIAMAVPNLVMRKLYVERLQTMLLPDPWERDDGISAAKRLYQKGDMQPLCEFVEQRYFKVFHNRDYIWANELTVKTAFLTLLYNDIFYIMDSESEADRRYADLTMIVRPDMRRFTILDILIEFKFVRLKDAGVSGEQARKLTREELQALPQMAGAMDDAKLQVKSYGETLEKRHGKLRLRKYAVVSLGFERIWWDEI